MSGPWICSPVAPARGVVLLFALISLAVMLIGAVALMRGMDNSLLLAGNLGFRRDLVNQAERGTQRAIAQLGSGDLATEAARERHLPAQNYSAIQLDSDSHGIPRLLLDDRLYAAAGYSAADIVDATTGVRVRYLIDRLCHDSGDYTLTSCVTADNGLDSAADDRYRRVNAEQRPVYRISVRASGPRNTQAFFQTTVTR